MEIGGKNTDFECGVNLGGANVKKVGTGEMKFAGSSMGKLEISAGKMCFSASTALPTSISFPGGALTADGEVYIDPSAKITGNTAAIVFDSDYLATWETSLTDSNEGGLTKRGTGVLTLAAVPNYKGTTMVEAGTLLFAAGSTIEELPVAIGMAF